jgi:hypothetical protein
MTLTTRSRSMPTSPVTPTITDRLRAAMVAGDEQELAALLHPRAHWSRPGATGRRGSAEVLRHFGELRARTRGVAVVETFTYPGAVVLGLELAPGPAGGGGAGLVYRVFAHAEGRVTAIHDHSDRAQALDTALCAGYDPHPLPAPEPAGAPGAAPEGGEPACLLHRLCPECDAVLDAPPPAACWRCGTELTASRDA